MKSLTYSLVDVFTTEPFGGNQLAVFEDGAGLSTDLMQQIARELNLSETVFIQPSSVPTKKAKLRIFTPQVELPMAGHPTIGTAYIMAEKIIQDLRTGANEWVFEEGVGDVPVTVYKDHSRVSKVEMEQPLPVFGDYFKEKRVAAALLSLSVDEIDTGLPIQTVSTGVPFLYIPIRSLASMKKIKFRTDIWEKHFSGNSHTKHIFTFSTETEDPASTVNSRMFAPAMGISEDPASGAASGPLGAYLVQNGVVPPYEGGNFQIRSEQGIEMGRLSYIDITIKKQGTQWKNVKIGGTAVMIGSGQLTV